MNGLFMLSPFVTKKIKQQRENGDAQAKREGGEEKWTTFCFCTKRGPQPPRDRTEEEQEAGPNREGV